MLLRFRFKNYRSFKGEQELSLVASSLRDTVAPVQQTGPLQHGGLCVAATYGANASGKTNVVRAFQYMKNAIEQSQRTWKPEGPIVTDPFLLEKETQTQPSSFEVDLLLGGKRFEYGFVLSSQQVLEEWLYAYPNGRRQLWFGRNQADKPGFHFSKHLSGENRTIENLTRPNSLFLSAAAQNNHEQLTPIYRWFADDVMVLVDSRSSAKIFTANMCKDASNRQAVFDLLGSADLGIVGLDVAENEGLKQLAEGIISIFTTGSPDSSEKSALPALPPNLLLRHRTPVNSDGLQFNTTKESAGTMTWLSLLGPVVRTLFSGGVLCVDELNASLHPLLGIELVKLFNDPTRNHRFAQLIFNTHDTNLLESAELRRDQIWFVEKDDGGASHLYALTDFKPRRHENYERGYLQGRYGAIPFVHRSGSFRESEDDAQKK